MSLLRYFAGLSKGTTVLWCYLIWYLVTVCLRFDPSPRLWLNSIGISAVIGVALLLSVSTAGKWPERWQVFRLFAMPFGVSSFSALIKGRDYVVIFPSNPNELLLMLLACSSFIIFVALTKKLARSG